MRKWFKLLLNILIILLTAACAEAQVAVDSTVSLSPYLVNTTFYFASEQAYNYINVLNYSVDFGGIEFYAIPASSVNVTVVKVSSKHIEFTATSNDRVIFKFTGLPAASYQISVDGNPVLMKSVENGLLYFEWSSWSTHSFKIVPVVEYYTDAFLGLMIGGIMVLAVFFVGGMVLKFASNPVMRMIVVGGMGLAMLALITYFIMTIS